MPQWKSFRFDLRHLMPNKNILNEIKRKKKRRKI